MRSALDRTLPVLLLSWLALALAACGGGGAPVCGAEYIVNKTADTNDGACSADDCSLREAVINTNARAGW